MKNDLNPIQLNLCTLLYKPFFFFFYKKECCASSISNYNNDSLKCVQNLDKFTFMKDVGEIPEFDGCKSVANILIIAGAATGDSAMKNGLKFKWLSVPSNDLCRSCESFGELTQLIVTVISLALVMEYRVHIIGD